VADGGHGILVGCGEKRCKGASLRRIAGPGKESSGGRSARGVLAPALAM